MNGVVETGRASSHNGTPLRREPPLRPLSRPSDACESRLRTSKRAVVPAISIRVYLRAPQCLEGLVFSFIFFDHPAGDTRTFQTPDGRTVTAGPKQPWTREPAETFRLEKGKIRQIMALMERVSYGMNSGWSTWEEGMSSAARDATKQAGGASPAPAPFTITYEVFLCKLLKGQ